MEIGIVSQSIRRCLIAHSSQCGMAASSVAEGRVAQICRAGFRACRLRSFPTSRAKADGLARNPGTGKSPEPADRNVCPTSEAEIDLGNTPQGYGGRVDGQVGATCRDDGLSFPFRQSILQKAFTGQRA